MSRRLLALNALLLAASVGSAAYIARQLTAPPPRPAPVRGRPGLDAAPTPSAETAPASRPGAAANAVIAARNLFSPTRTEAPAVAAAPGRPAVALPKPLLHGVVIREGAPVAYLEDPTTKRVAGYRLGDAIAGGTLQTINTDNVVLTRPEGPVDVPLRDPAKPRPALPPQPQAGSQPGQPAPPRAGAVIPPPQQGQAPAPQPAPGVQQPPESPQAVPGRRPLPPNLMRRLTPGAVPDATTQQ